MLQHIRKLSGSSSSSDSDLSESWNVVDHIEEVDAENDTNIQNRLVTEDQGSGDQEVGLAQCESSSDGESVEVIDHDELALDESVDDNTSVTDLPRLRDTGSGDGELSLVTERGRENPDDVELWRPFSEKFEEVMTCSWCSFIMVTLSILIMCNVFSILSYVVFDSQTEPDKPTNVEKIITALDDAPHILYATKSLASDDTPRILHSTNSLASDDTPRILHSTKSLASDDTPRILHSTKSLASDDTPRVLHSTNSPASDDTPHILHSTNSLASDDTPRILHSTKSLASDDTPHILHSTNSLASDDTPRILHSTKSPASDGVKETNTYDYVIKENTPRYEENDYDKSILYPKQFYGLTDDGDVSVDIDEDVGLKAENDKLFNYELKTQSNKLVNDVLVKEFDSSNTFVKNEKVEKDFNFDILELGKTFKMLTDLNMSQDSKYKIGRSLLILDSLFVGLSDLESQFSKNSPLDLKLKKQKLRVSQGIVEEINRGISKSLDNLANRIFNKVQKLESNIQNHWCHLQSGIEKVDKNMFCDFKKKKNKNVEKELKKNKFNRRSNKKNFLEQNKKIEKHEINKHKTYKKKQHKENKNPQEKVNEYKFTKHSWQNENKLKKDQSIFRNQPKNKKQKYVKMEDIVNIENITQNWNENDNLKYEKKIINPINDKTKLDYKVIEHKNKLKKWNIIIDDNSMNNKTISGEWFLNSGDARSEIRWNHHRSDWVFDRAMARRNKKLTSYWFFQRAWARHQCRQNPTSDWCMNTIMTLNPNAKFR